MTECLQNNDKKAWSTIERIFCILFLLLYMTGKLNYYLAESLLHSYFVVLAVVLISFSLYFYRLQEGKEIRLLAAFWLWYAISRILGGDVVLKQYGVLLLSLAVCFEFTGLGMRSSYGERNRDLCILSIAICTFYFLMGLICLYGMFMRKPVLNPITADSYIVYSTPDRFTRMGLFEIHSNMTAAMFMVPVFLLLHRLTCRKKISSLVLAFPLFIVYLLCIGLTYSRSGMICTSFGISLFVSLLILRSINNCKICCKIAVVLLTVIVIVPLGYKTIELSVRMFGQGSASWLTHKDSNEYTESIPDSVFSSESAKSNIEEQQGEERTELIPDSVFSSESAESFIEEQQEEEHADIDIETLFEDKRDFAKDARTLTARTPLFRSAFLALREEPIRILIGENDDEKMLYYANNVVQTEQHFVHMHNFLLQTLMVTGLPGLLLVMWFCVWLVIHSFQLFFLKPSPLKDKILVIPIACYLLFFQLESGLFTDVTVVTLFFFLIAGYIIGINDSIKTVM